MTNLSRILNETELDRLKTAQSETDMGSLPHLFYFCENITLFISLLSQFPQNKSRWFSTALYINRNAPPAPQTLGCYLPSYIHVLHDSVMEERAGFRFYRAVIEIVHPKIDNATFW